MRKLLLISLFALALPSAVLAQDDDWRNRRGRDDRRYRNDENAFELTPFVGYRYGGTLYSEQTGFTDDVEAESGMNYGASFAIPIGNDGFKLELMANRQDTHLTAGRDLFSPIDRVADFSVTYYHAGLIVPFARTRNATPYFIVSAGVANLDPEIAGFRSENRFSASGGIGVKLPFSNNMGFRLEARGYYTTVPNDDFCRVCSYSSDRQFYQGETNAGVYFRF